LHVSADGVHPAGLLDGGAGGDTLVIADHVGSYVADLRALTIKSIETFAFGDPGTGGTATIEMNAAQFVAVGWTVHGTIVGSGQTDVLEIHMGDHGQIELGELVFDNFDGHLSVVGTSDGQYFYGSTIADSIAAGGGQDALFYTTGYDTLDGGAGDAIDGHSDQVVFSGAVGGVILTLNGSADSIYKVNGIDSGVVRNIEGVTGSEGNDSITGDSGDNWLNGNGGSDTIDGGDGIDTLTFLGGWAYSAYVDLAAGTYSVLSSGLPGASTISNIENVIGSGSLSGDDNANVLDSSWGFGGTLLGRGGNDSLIANVLGLGGSHLDGGAGQDSLRGGGGADTFVFSALTDSGPGGNRDVILGFDTGVGLGASVGDDVIDVSALFAGDLVYRGTNAFDGLGQLRVRASGSDVIVEVNAEGDLAADFSIRLSGTTLASMTASDFIL
jgi:Ca2+-binding RTX toxin-like protein